MKKKKLFGSFLEFLGTLHKKAYFEAFSNDFGDYCDAFVTRFRHEKSLSC